MSVSGFHVPQMGFLMESVMIHDFRIPKEEYI